MRWPNGIADHLANVERALQQQTKIQRKNPYQRFSVTAVLDKTSTSMFCETSMHLTYKKMNTPGRSVLTFTPIEGDLTLQ
jgi:hypothetical protein